ncbi:MAG: hypothetical protein KJ884_12910 [Gammaproteobacteria bacterium]|nr:hypothetical protein [Gammaproteobacteria bacterium]MBU1490964.1 hypothetical protein [Gammaproteobacteria bacterium]MBU2064602.1 hypothetical protein [Gammaproteobacteria bacterium]MBU2138600.1 hypothetical protein [Gammaproteobacteria bacterium]MBU2217045.1 hypothetical protein [Gammaproteobacteria bacterium]
MARRLLHKGKPQWFAECAGDYAMDEYQEELLEQRALAEEPSEPQDDAMEL